MNSWQHLYQKLDVPAEVVLNGFIGVDSDIIVVQEVIEDGTVSEMLMARDGGPVDDVAEANEEEDEGKDDVALTLSNAANMVRIRFLVA
jgi:hypothetical protein